MRESAIMIAICSVIAIGALGVAVWTLFSGQVHKQGIDALFLILVCLLLLVAFAPMPVQALRKAGWPQRLKRKLTGNATAEALKPGAASVTAKAAEEVVQKSSESG